MIICTRAPAACCVGATLVKLLTNKLVFFNFSFSPRCLAGVVFGWVVFVRKPGANFVEDSSGRMIYLDRLSDLKRRGVAARLLSNPGQKVGR